MLLYCICPAGCTVSNGSMITVSCDISGNIAVGDSKQVPLVVRPTVPGTLSSNATVTAPGEKNTANNGPAIGVITVGRTCVQYNSDGSKFDCGNGFAFKNVTSNNPNKTVCCVSTLIAGWSACGAWPMQ